MIKNLYNDIVYKLNYCTDFIIDETKPDDVRDYHVNLLMQTLNEFDYTLSSLSDDMIYELANLISEHLPIRVLLQIFSKNQILKARLRLGDYAYFYNSSDENSIITVFYLINVYINKFQENLSHLNPSKIYNVCYKINQYLASLKSVDSEANILSTNLINTFSIYQKECFISMLPDGLFNDVDKVSIFNELNNTDMDLLFTTMIRNQHDDGVDSIKDIIPESFNIVRAIYSIRIIINFYVIAGIKALVISGSYYYYDWDFTGTSILADCLESIFEDLGI